MTERLQFSMCRVERNAGPSTALRFGRDDKLWDDKPMA